jgi:signal transduction histidine kinase
MGFIKREKPRKKGVKSLGFNIWLYFVLFVIFVVAIMWAFQVAFFKRFYESLKENEIKSVAAFVEQTHDTSNFAENLRDYAHEKEVCVAVLDNYGRQVFPSECLLERNCILHENSTNTPKLLREILGRSGQISKRETNTASGAEILIFGKAYATSDGASGYMLINSPLIPVTSTANVIQNQMYIITALLFGMGLLLSAFAARMIATPIEQITKGAKNFGKSGAKFEGDGYIEVCELADMLNYATSEIAKVDTRQRDLIANVSHDLRTPLTMIKGYAEMIRDLSGDRKEKREEHLGIIIAETDRLALLVNDMLDLSKFESGAPIGLNFETVNITEKLNEIVTRYNGISGRTGYKVLLDPDEDRLCKVDVSKIERVIGNFINNAMSYAGEDKTVYVRQINTDKGVRIEVRDNGRGIPEDELRLIFDKYYRSSNRKREDMGTGLGLSIAKSILKKHKFPYGVQSAVGRGSIFWFMITSENTKSEG